MKNLWKIFKPSDPQEYCPANEDVQDRLTSPQAQIQRQLAKLQQFEQDCQERLATRWHDTRALLAISQEFDQPDVPVLKRQIVTIGLEYLLLQAQPDQFPESMDINFQRKQLLRVISQHSHLLQAILERKKDQLAISEEHDLADQALLRKQIKALEQATKHL